MLLICLPLYSSKQLQQNVRDRSHELIFQKNLLQEAYKQHIRFHFQILYIVEIYRYRREQSEKVHYEPIKGQALIYGIKNIGNNILNIHNHYMQQ